MVNPSSLTFSRTAAKSSAFISWWSALTAMTFSPSFSYRRSSFSANCRIAGERELHVAQ